VVHLTPAKRACTKGRHIMLRIIHPLAGALALLTIALFAS
jgi:hypothetical protein